MKLKIGILLPQSYRYPLMTHQFVNGIRSCVGLFENMEIELVLRDTGAANESAVMTAANTLILSDQVDLITGIVSENVISEVRNLFHQAKMPLIATNVGARVPSDLVKSPYIFTHTLNLWESCWHFGHWATEQYGKKIMMATSFYDGGYSMTFSFVQGAQAVGGELNSNYITPKIPWENSSEVLQGVIREHKPDYIFAGFSGDDALRFMADYQKIDPAKRVPVVAAPYVTDEVIIDDHEGRANGLQNAFTWSPGLDTPGNAVFKKAFQAEARRTPDGFAVLGYEVGLMVANAVRKMDGYPGAKEFVKTLLAERAEGPRGKIVFDAETQRSGAEVWLREVVETDGDWENKPLKVLGSSLEAQKSLMMEPGQTHSGWVNPYLCV